MAIRYIFSHYFRPQNYKKPQNEQENLIFPIIDYI